MGFAGFAVYISCLATSPYSVWGESAWSRLSANQPFLYKTNQNDFKILCGWEALGSSLTTQEISIHSDAIGLGYE